LITCNTEIKFWQSSHIFLISLFCCNPIKSEAPAKFFACIQYCAKSVAWWPNLWYGGQICGMAAKSVAQQPNLWQGSQMCGTGTKSIAQHPNLWHKVIFVAQQPNLLHGSQICGTQAKSIAWWPNLWRDGLICKMDAKSENNIVKKEQKFDYILPFLS